MRTDTKPKMQPPDKPKHRNMRVLSASREIVPYFLQGDPDKINAMIDAGKMNDLFDDEDIIAVGVGHLKMRSHMEFETRHGEVLDTFVNKILWLFWAMGQIADDKVTEKPEIVTIEGVTDTPYGKMYGSLQRNIAQCMCFVLSQFGQIVGVGEKGFDFEPIGEDEIYDLLDPASLMNVEENTDLPAFFEIISIAGLRPPDDGKRPETAEDDDSKNSASPISGGRSTNASRRRGNSSGRQSKAKPT